MHSDEPQSFEEFWPYYVSQHLHPVNRALHFVGTNVGLAHAVLSPLFPPALIAAPVWGYGLSWIGHFAFEKNTPASWASAKHFAWSFRGDMRMLKLMWQRKMQAEVDAVTGVAARPDAARVPTEPVAATA
jgi:hypothetical protein